ncbi:hypothetical protein ACN20G_33420 (plasmid) [Streptomyces sp. BI20]|uniref:hypothetical protein n=1 Tax=Streptomyces sp. BI20 TaxID=3403460 RepID=UPI003C707495
MAADEHDDTDGDDARRDDEAAPLSWNVDSEGWRALQHWEPTDEVAGASARHVRRWKQRLASLKRDIDVIRTSGDDITLIQAKQYASPGRSKSVFTTQLRVEQLLQKIHCSDEPIFWVVGAEEETPQGFSEVDRNELLARLRLRAAVLRQALALVRRVRRLQRAAERAALRRAWGQAASSSVLRDRAPCGVLRLAAPVTPRGPGRLGCAPSARTSVWVLAA